MPKLYETTIKASYGNWDVYAGLRELIQNARDGEIQYGAKMTVEHVYRVRNKKPIGAIVITNEGITVPKEAFLTGHTTKSNRSDLIGLYGEGFKYGSLALLQQDIDIKIRNGSESWLPKIVRSKNYDAEVLAFEVHEGNKEENRFQVEVLGIDFDKWQEYKKKFLFLNEKTYPSVDVYGGKILLSPEHKGMLYVKGMWVCKNDKFNFGYDFDNAQIDRDRRMVDDPNTQAANLLAKAVQKGELVTAIYRLLSEGSEEAASFPYYLLGDEGQEKIVKKFKEQFGEDTLPVEGDDQIQELSHLGKQGVKVPYALRNILVSALGSTRDNIVKLRTSITKQYSTCDLTEEESNNLEVATRLVSEALHNLGYSTDSMSRIYVVDFVDPKLGGTYNSGDCSIRMARKRLETKAKAIRLLIHEAAHVAGGDGSKAHEQAIGDLTEFVLNKVMH